MILSDTYNTPFDNDRKGLNLGEAAAFLVLESDEVVQKSNKKVLAYVSGFGNANDAFHQTASSENGEGAFLAMQKAFKLANLQPNDIDYINAHGTATPNNDLSEGRAILRIFNDNGVEINENKNGVFINLTYVDSSILDKVYKYLSYVSKQEDQLNEIEKEKEKIVSSFFT